MFDGLLRLMLDESILFGERNKMEDSCMAFFFFNFDFECMK